MGKIFRIHENLQSVSDFRSVFCSMHGDPMPTTTTTSTNNNFAFPGNAPAVSTKKDLRSLHAQLLTMSKEPQKIRPISLSLKNLTRDDVFTLTNKAYATLHGLRHGPFKRSEQLLVHLDEDGDGLVSCQDFEVRMPCLRTSKNTKSQLQGKQLARAARMRRAKDLIRKTREMLLDEIEQMTLRWSPFSKALSSFTNVFPAVTSTSPADATSAESRNTKKCWESTPL